MATCTQQRWSRKHKARGQVPRTQKKSKSQGQGQPFQGQSASVLKKKIGLQKIFFQAISKIKIFKNFFLAISYKKRSPKFFFRRSPKKINQKDLCKFYARFLAFSNKISTVQKIVLSSSTIFWIVKILLERTWTSRPRPRTSKCVLEDVHEAKDVLDDSTFGMQYLNLLALVHSLRPVFS